MDLINYSRAAANKEEVCKIFDVPINVVAEHRVRSQPRTKCEVGLMVNAGFPAGIRFALGSPTPKTADDDEVEPTIPILLKNFPPRVEF